ncbi:pfkB family kinase [Penicillium verhagenii]|uniref:pfkB family kinase n=1 Tax=Penicillium verhagenii TaxID=1562060 RepID=UPI0025456972|nr:pfkB family kinase [Penicillium verhagenii]KAJ5924431.1 pfkB family kinase [Penicillium verhagenii]
MSLVAVGACYVDTILSTSRYPGEDEKLRASKIVRRRGGNCPNSLEVLQQLTAIFEQELALNLVTVLPAKSSVASQQIISALEPRVQLSHCIHRDQFQEPASCYIIKSQSTGSRTIVNHCELPDMTVEEFVGIAEKLGPQATWFHFEGRIPKVTLGCIQHLRRDFPSARISVELEKPGREGLHELADHADVVFYSKTWAQNLGYTSAEECLRNQAARTQNALLLCCTWGQDGADALDLKTGEFVHVDAFTPADFHVIDPVGAGDTFNAGMLYALNCKEKEWDLSEKVRFANRLAGIKVAQEGFSGLGQAMGSYDPR